MERFIDGPRRWPPHRRIWHLYAVPRLHAPANADLAALLHQHHTRLTTDPLAAHLSAVPARWLHATVRKLSLDPTAVSDSERQTYLKALRETLTPLEPFTVQCTPTVNRWSTLLHINDPDRGFEKVDEAVVQATAATLGHQALQHPPNSPHLTTGYCTSATDSTPYAQATHTTPVPWTVNTLVLANVLQDATAHQYRWDTLATFHLGGTEVDR
ncbi:hypothetical protein [Nocardiopsis nanhaiensis]